MANKHPILKKWFYVAWHRFTARRFSIRWVGLNFIILGSWFFAFIFTPLRTGKIGLALGVSATISYVLYGFLQSYIGNRSPSRKHQAKRKIARKVMTTAILDKMLVYDLEGQRNESAGIALLEDILDLIVDHVRAFRHDREGEKIFCTLFVEYDDEHLKIIARNRSGRTGGPPIRKKSDLQAWTTMSTFRVIESGNILIDYPSTPLDKPYKSVLTIPIKFSDKCIAVLSIDSSEPYHFTGHAEQLNTTLLPYTVLFKMVLVKWNLLERGGG